VQRDDLTCPLRKRRSSWKADGRSQSRTPQGFDSGRPTLGIIFNPKTHLNRRGVLRDHRSVRSSGTGTGAPCLTKPWPHSRRTNCRRFVAGVRYGWSFTVKGALPRRYISHVERDGILRSRVKSGSPAKVRYKASQESDCQRLSGTEGGVVSGQVRRCLGRSSTECRRSGLANGICKWLSGTKR